MMKYDYDFFVIGGGSGGVRASRIASTLGAKVAVAEDRYIGGTCVNVGCVPKKLFVYASHFMEETKHAAGFGWNVEGVEFNWNTLLENKNGEISRLNTIYEGILERAGVELIYAKAVVTGPNEVLCGDKLITAKYILVAPGSWPSVPEFPGSEHVITSNEAFFLDGLPEKALVVGGGYIGVEFAGILNGLDVDVTLSYRGDLFLRGFDISLREFLRDEMTKKGVNLEFNSNILSIEKTAAGLEVAFADGSKDTFGKILYATGRIPNTKGLGLETAAVKLSERGAILVDDEFRSSCPSIFAVGDVIDRVQLTPVALAEGNFLANLLFGEKSKPVDYNLIPTAVFSQPELATVGLTEAEAVEKYGDDIKIFKGQFKAMRFSLAQTDEKTLVKMIVQKSSDKVVGVHMGGVYGAEIMQGIGVALKSGATKEDFDDTIGIHPTSAEELVTMK
jgi:glutathione reductase (NADPH)